MKTKILFMLILTGCVMNAYSQTNFNGFWIYQCASSSFSLEINQVNSSISGGTCAFADFGNFIDCDDSEIPKTLSGNVEGDSVHVTFTSTYCGKQGKAVIKKLSSNQITWRITEKPDGVYYFPDNALLTLESYPKAGCFTLQPGYVQISSNVVNYGTNVTFNLAFYPTNHMQWKTKYKIATISENCRPTEIRYFPFYSRLRFWTLEIDPNGDVFATMQLVPENNTYWYGPAYESVSCGPVGYDL